MNSTTTTRPKPNLHRLALNLATCLGAAWRAAPLDPENDHGARIHGPAGASLWLSADWKGKVELAGTFRMMASGRIYSAPKDAYGRISFDPTRDAASLARDVERRCLSVYLPAYIKAVEETAADARSREQATEAAARIAGACKVEARSPQGSDGTIRIFPEVAGCYALEPSCPRAKGRA